MHRFSKGGALRLESRRERWIERGGEGELGSCERGRTRFVVFRREGRFRVGLNDRDEHGARNCLLMPNTQTHAQLTTLGNGGGVRSRKDFIDERNGKSVISCMLFDGAFMCVHSLFRIHTAS